MKESFLIKPVLSGWQDQTWKTVAFYLTLGLLGWALVQSLFCSVFRGVIRRSFMLEYMENNYLSLNYLLWKQVQLSSKCHWMWNSGQYIQDWADHRVTASGNRSVNTRWKKLKLSFLWKLMRGTSKPEETATVSQCKYPIVLMRKKMSQIIGSPFCRARCY